MFSSERRRKRRKKGQELSAGAVILTIDSCPVMHTTVQLSRIEGLFGIGAFEFDRSPVMEIVDVVKQKLVSGLI